MDIRIVAFDIDGTLVPRGQKTIAPGTKKALAALNDKGIYTLVATGRIVTFIQPDVIKTIKSDYYVTINGAVITDGDQNVLKTFPIGEVEFEHLLKGADDHGIAIGFKYAKEMIVYNMYDEFTEVYSKGHDVPHLVLDYTKTRDYHITHGLPMGAFLIGKEADLVKLREDEVLDRWLVRAYEGAMEFAKTGKGTAIEWVAEHLGLDKSQIMAFGDSDNDIAMLQMAEIGVAMGNAHPDVKAIADHITADCDDDGILKALEHFGLI